MCNCNKTMKKIVTLILIIGFYSCNQEKNWGASTNTSVDNYDLLEKLYHQCDTVIETADTLKIVNSKLDTIIIETGIFIFLQYDYPLTTPHTLVELAKSAIQFDNHKEKDKAKPFFRDMVDFYNDDRPKELKGFSDMNEYFQYEVNSAILCSYAYERLGESENSIKTLQPFLANTEAWDSKIHERYIQLCIDKFGIDKVRAELNNCGKTIKLKKQDAPEKDDWVVNVFGADIGVGKAWETDHITSSKADSLVRQMDFYKLTL